MASNVLKISRTRLWSVNALADEFGKNWGQVKRALRDVPPDGEIRGKPAWLVSTASPHLVQPPADGDTGQPNMTAKERFDYVRSERELMKLRVDAGELLPMSEHREILSNLAKQFINSVDSMPDILEKKCGLTASQAAQLEKEIDALRMGLYESILDGD